MTLSEKQKNCPYCHPNDNNPKDQHGNTAWYRYRQGYELELDMVANDPNVEQRGLCMGDISFNPLKHYLSSLGDGVNPLIVHIQYCPFCGRKLGD